MPECGLYEKVFRFRNVMWLILGLQFFALPAFSAEGNKSLISQDAHDPLIRNFSHTSSFPGDGLPQDFFVDSDGNIIQYLPHGQTQIVGQAISTIPAKASSRVKFTGNLDASAPVLVHVTNSSLLADPFHPGISQFSTSFPIFDSLGIRHDLTIVYTKTSTNIWQYTCIARASEVSVVADYTNHITDNALVLQGRIGFNSSGLLNREEAPKFFNTHGTGIDFTTALKPGRGW